MEILIISVITGAIITKAIFYGLKKEDNHPHRIINQHYKKINRWILIFIFFLATSFMQPSKNEIAYLVTVSHHNPNLFGKTHFYQFTSTGNIDNLMHWNFGKMIPDFNAEMMFKHTNHFRLQTDHCTIYCEKKQIAGKRKNGKLILRQIQQ